MILLRRIVKAHVRDYDRVTKTGAIEHIRAHEDSRVRSYARKILGSKDSYDLHTIRRDRFGHLPHWSKLDEHTRQAVLDAEEEKAHQHKTFEEWKEKVHGKKKDAEKVDRSGWEQQMMFKSRRVRHVAYILRKSNKNHEPVGGGDGEKGGQFAPRDIEQDVSDFEQVLEAFKTDQLDMRRPAKVMGHTPAILRQFGAKNHEIDIDPNDIKKIVLSWRQEGGKHGIPVELAKNLPKWLSEPIMVFDSNTRPNSIVVLTEAEHEGQPIYVAIQLERDRGRKHYVNRVASTYNRPDGDVERWVKAGLLRMYDNKKGSEWLRARGLRLPTAGTSLQSLSKKTVLLKSKQVNYIIVAPPLYLVRRRGC